MKKTKVSVPMIMQVDVAEDGAACLSMVLGYYKKWIPLEQIRADCGMSRDGSNMDSLNRVSLFYGLKGTVVNKTIDELRNDTEYPCIIRWRERNFAVLRGFEGKKALINDPARGSVKIPIKELEDIYNGECLCLEPGEGFVPSGKKKTVVSFAASRLIGAGGAVVFILLVTAIGYMFSIINPIMSRVFYDYLLSGNARSWLTYFIVLMAMLGIIQIIVEWTRAIYSLKINGKMDIEGNTSFMWKLFRLPIDFFSQREAGDILERQQTNAGIAGILISTVAPLLINTAMMIFYLIVMLRYSVAMTAVGVASVVVNLCIAQYMSKRRVNLARVRMRDQGKWDAATVTGINMAETIKSAGAEGGFFRKWAGYMAAVNTNFEKTYSFNLSVGIIPQFVSALSGYIILFMGVSLAIKGEFTIGMVTTFQGLLLAFNGPAQSMIEAGQTIHEMKSSMERVEDVMNYPEDPLSTRQEIADDTNCKKLNGEIEFRNVTFGYSRMKDPIIRDFSIHIKPGSRVAIVGGSGCGKSTVSKMVTGLYQPWEGEILFGGVPLEQIPRSVFTSSVAMVDQDVFLFRDTIANNIRMWDETISEYDMILAARDAQIHDDIVARQGGYQSMVTENGRNMSGGQRQRMEIARTLAQDPSIIVMDEATSALDAKTEHEVVEAINARGITCIVIAHRLSTIRDCDEIIFLKNGVIAERGTHDELVALGGNYCELVKNE